MSLNIALTEVAIIVDARMDNVALVKKAAARGNRIDHGAVSLKLLGDIQPGDRFALHDIPAGDYLYQYGYPFARSLGILQGETITGNNTSAEIPTLPESFVTPSIPGSYGMDAAGRTFMGYRRTAGRCGTRNFYIVVPTSMCASAVAQQIAERFSDEYPGVDAVMALPNTEGCGCAAGTQIERFLNILKNSILHENVGGALIVDLGCEQTNYPVVRQYLESVSNDGPGKPVDWLTIQQVGGVVKTVSHGIAVVKERLRQLASVSRESCPLSALTVGSECGASDAFSGVTANRVIGNALDKVIAAGGSAVFSEFPEMVGAEQILFPRMRSAEVIEKFIRQMNWYRDMAQKLGTSMDYNLVPENRAGGLINPFIKSLGAVMKGGTAAIEDVLDYGQRISRPGLHIMQGPGNDLESVTGLAASGATIICFSTGRGTVTGCALAPVIKVAATSALATRMADDMDFDAGSVLESSAPAALLEDLGNRLLETIIAVASGQRTKPEINRQRQFQIWTAGKLSL